MAGDLINSFGSVKEYNDRLGDPGVNLGTKPGQSYLKIGVSGSISEVELDLRYIEEVDSYLEKETWDQRNYNLTKEDYVGLDFDDRLTLERLHAIKDDLKGEINFTYVFAINPPPSPGAVLIESPEPISEEKQKELVEQRDTNLDFINFKNVTDKNVIDHYLLFLDILNFHDMHYPQEEVNNKVLECFLKECGGMDNNPVFQQLINLKTIYGFSSEQLGRLNVNDVEELLRFDLTKKEENSDQVNKIVINAQLRSAFGQEKTQEPFEFPHQDKSSQIDYLLDMLKYTNLNEADRLSFIVILDGHGKIEEAYKSIYTSINDGSFWNETERANSLSEATSDQPSRVSGQIRAATIEVGVNDVKFVALLEKLGQERQTVDTLVVKSEDAGRSQQSTAKLPPPLIMNEDQKLQARKQEMIGSLPPSIAQ